MTDEIVYIAASHGSEWFADMLTDMLNADKYILAKFKAVKNIGASYKYDEEYKLKLNQFIINNPKECQKVPEDKIEELFWKSDEYKNYSKKFTAKYIGEQVDENITDVLHRAILVSGVGMGAGFWGINAPSRKPTKERRVRASVAKNRFHAKRVREKYIMNTICVPTAIENFRDERELKKDPPQFIKYLLKKEVENAFKEIKEFLMAEPDTSTREKQISVMQTIKLQTYATNPQMLKRWGEYPEREFERMEQKQLELAEHANNTKKKHK